MPIYEYECSDCGVVTEAWQKITDPPLDKCDNCGGHLRKLISQSTFHLKGTGWYVTDYASKSPGSSRPEKGKESKGDSKKEGSETKSKSTSKKDD